MIEILELKKLPKDGLESSWRPVARYSDVFWFHYKVSQASGPMTEILKLKELPNDGLETSWGALWLGIHAFFRLNVDYRKHHVP